MKIAKFNPDLFCAATRQIGVVMATGGLVQAIFVDPDNWAVGVLISFLALAAIAAASFNYASTEENRS